MPQPGGWMTLQSCGLSALSGHDALPRTAPPFLRCSAGRSCTAGGVRLPGPVHRLLPRAHRIRPALLPAMVRRPNVPPESPTLGFTHLQFEALLTAAREPASDYDFALVAMLGLLGLRIFEATGADIADLGEEHGHRVLRVCGKGTKVVLVPLPPAVGRAIDRAVAARVRGPILLNTRGTRMDRHAATRRLHRLAEAAGLQVARSHPHLLRHTYVTTMQGRGVASDATFRVWRED